MPYESAIPLQTESILPEEWRKAANWAVNPEYVDAIPENITFDFQDGKVLVGIDLAAKPDQSSVARYHVVNGKWVQIS